ncbi:MAG: O-antigen ligase family protein, partial [Coriobacteriia bacterium]|nr:O-antigen ligase family protein [Coriobacteriia bacterium]
MTQVDRYERADVARVDTTTSRAGLGRVRAETVGMVSLLIALFGPALAYADGWAGGHSIFKFFLLALGGAGALACAPWLKMRRAEKTRLGRALTISVIAYVGWVGLAALFSEQTLLGITGARPYWDGFVAALAAGGCFAFAFHMADGKAPVLRRWLSHGAAWTAIVLAVVALAAWMGLPGTADMIKAGRLGSAIGQPTFLGLYFSMWLPWLLHASRTARSAADHADDAETARRASRSFALFLAASVAAVALLVASQSRAAVVAGVVGVSLYAALSAKSSAARRKRLAAAAVLVLLAALLAVGLRDPEFIETGPAELASRFVASGRGVAWEAAAKATAADPLLGSGPGTFEYAHAANMTPELFAVEEGTRLLDAHNWYLTASATAGVPAAIAALAIAVLCVLGAVRSRGRPSFRLAACSGAVACAAGAVLTPNGFVTLPAMLVLATVGVTFTRAADASGAGDAGAPSE